MAIQVEDNNSTFWTLVVIGGMMAIGICVIRRTIQEQLSPEHIVKETVETVKERIEGRQK